MKRRHIGIARYLPRWLKVIYGAWMLRRLHRAFDRMDEKR